MNLSERRRQFEAASKADPLLAGNTKLHKLFGVSNSAKVIGRGLQLGVVNLNNVTPERDGLAFACNMVFPPADEVYFTAYVRSGMPTMIQRLSEMKRLGAEQEAAKNAAKDARKPKPAAKVSGTDEDEEAAEEEEAFGYAERNNNTVVVLTTDGNFHVRNQGFWGEMPEDLTPFGPPIPVDKINVAVYPPPVSARRSLLARDFIGYLGNIVGREKVHELRVWDEVAAVSPEMQRIPVTIPVVDIEAAVTALGGHYPGGEVRRFHAAMNFLPHKHFVILAGLSGMGKTQLALKYARAVHGIGANTPDPFLFVCPVRPEWTDPTGLTGYYDVLSNRYTVPPFLEAVLLATAHQHSPVFVVLDEMNLARVEYYFSDVLSCIETGEVLQLHAHGVPLEGSNGTAVPSTLPMPSNLYIAGTVNIDETTNPVSDKVLDRAIVIDMSTVDLAGFLDALENREPSLKAATEACGARLIAAQQLMASYGLGFGYRVAEEAVRYQAFSAEHLKEDAASVADALMVQKVLVKLRGGERQRPLLTGLIRTLDGLPHAQAFLAKLAGDLDEFGSFQASR
jgi:5-methylcytosine-specific restriction enzyme B